MQHAGAPLDDAAWPRWWQQTGENELGQLLHWKWDPINIANAFPWAADEYNMYAPQIADSLKARPDVDRVADILRGIETERMGHSDSAAAAAHRLSVAGAIVEWYANSQERWRQFGPRPR